MNSLATQIDRCFSINKDRIFLESIDSHTSMTYGNVKQCVENYIKILSSKGLKEHDIVVIVFDHNSKDIICIVLALIMMNVISCPIKTSAFHIDVTQLNAKWIIFDDSYLKLQTLNNYTNIHDMDSLHLVSTNKSVTNYKWNANPILILPSSGTTGECKWIVLSDNNLLYNVNQIHNYMKTNEKDVFMAIKHLGHISTFTSDFLLSLFSGAKFVIYNDKFIPQRINKYIKLFGVTVITMVPTILNLLLNCKLPEMLVGVKKISLVGSCTSKTLINKAKKILPQTDIYIGYGLTEASSRVMYLPPQELGCRPSSIGKPIEGTRVWLHNQGDIINQNNEIGEIVVSGNGIMLGYLKNGILHRSQKELYTNDLAYRDEDGYYYFAGRKDDIININGEKISSIFIENIFEQMDKVEAVFVFQKEEISGIDIVVAIVVRKHGVELKEEEIFRHAQQKIDPRFIPKKIKIIDKIPLEMSGKISRKQLSKNFDVKH